MKSKKPNVPLDEKIGQQDIDLFEVLNRLDKKDYGYYDTLTEEQKKKIVPFLLTHWLSSIKANNGIARYYLMSTNEYANKYLFNEFVSKHPKLQWLMLCSASPGIGKQFHQYIPHIKDKVATYKEQATNKDIRDYFSKIYKNANEKLIVDLSQTYVQQQKKRFYLGKLFPNLKLSDLEALSEIVTEDDINQYEKDRGN